MQMRVTLRLGAAALPLLTVLLTACGGSGGSARNPGAASTSAASPAEASPAGAGGDFCAVIREELSGFEKVFPKDFSDAAQLMTFGRYLEDTNAKLLASAPGDIRPDVQVVAQVSNQEAASYKAGVKPPPGLSAQHRTPEFKAASGRLAAYGRDKCGLTPSSAPSG